MLANVSMTRSGERPVWGYGFQVGTFLAAIPDGKFDGPRRLGVAGYGRRETLLDQRLHFLLSAQARVVVEQNTGVCRMQIQNAGSAFESMRQAGNEKVRFQGNRVAERDQERAVARRP